MITKSSYTITELAALTGAAIIGNGEVVISEVGTIHQAKPNQVTFLANPLYKKFLANTQAGVVILNATDAAECLTNALVSPNPYATYAHIAQLLYPNKNQTDSGIHPTAVISKTAKIGENVAIGPHVFVDENVVIENDVVIGASCVIGPNSTIGAQTLLYSNVTLYSEVTLGQRVIIHSGVVIGSDGFGFANDRGRWIKVPQIGGVVIGDEVEVGANTTIDRGALGDTVIEENVKIDNQVQIGHNVSIGAHTVIAGCVGISGSTRVGRYCMIGGGTGVAGHIEVCDKVIVTGMTMLTRSITRPGLYSSGTGLDTNARWKKNAARFRNLDDFAKRIQQLERTLNELTQKSLEKTSS